MAVPGGRLSTRLKMSLMRFVTPVSLADLFHTERMSSWYLKSKLHYFFKNVKSTFSFKEIKGSALLLFFLCVFVSDPDPDPFSDSAIKLWNVTNLKFVFNKA
jgi:hypothetical protein